MKLLYIGKSFGVDSLTNGKVYEAVIEDENFYRVIDDSGESHLYSKVNPAPLDESSPRSRWGVIANDGTVFCPVIQRQIDGSDCLVIGDIADRMIKPSFLFEEFGVEWKEEMRQICRDCVFHYYGNNEEEENEVTTMDRFVQIKEDFESLCRVVTDALRKDGLREEIRTYVLSAIMQIWGSNVLYAPDYAALTEAIAGRKYTMEQIVTAMGCCAEPGRVIAVPQFYKELVQHDLDAGDRDSDTFLEKFNMLMVASATINGDFTVEEANALGVIYGSLLSHADRLGLLPPAKPDYSNAITPRDDSTYLQKTNDVPAAAQKHDAPQETASEKDAGAPVNITINTMNIVGEGSTALAPNTEAELTTAPEEAAAVTEADADPPETLESLLKELDGLVGLDGVKQDVHSLMNFIKVTKIREQRGMKVPKMSYHLVFTGNPGTGKTTIARLVAKLYFHMGLLPQGQLVETDRSALVAGYLGQTAIKTQKVIQQALGGVLFIDEAYALAGDTDDSYGKEAIETILKAMEDHRDELIVIVAGYTELMHKFIDSNPGLSSRFSKYFEFPDYTGEELLSIFERFCKKNGYRLTEDAATLLGEQFNALYATRDTHFGNARAARNIFEKAINAQANRIASLADFSDSDLECLTADDITQAIGGGNA